MQANDGSMLRGDWPEEGAESLFDATSLRSLHLHCLQSSLPPQFSKIQHLTELSVCTSATIDLPRDQCTLSGKSTRGY